MQDLSAGMTLYDARNDALLLIPVDSLVINDHAAVLNIFGDNNMRLHNTAYSGTTGTWFK